MKKRHGRALSKRYGRAKPKLWIAGAIQHPGALHHALGVPEGEKIPLSKLRWAAKQPGHLGRQARFALNARGFKHHHGHR